MTELQQRTLQVAKAKVGQREATGRNDGPFVRMLQRFVANGAAWLDGQPWCIMFVTWAIHAAAKDLNIKPVVPKNASSSSLYQWARRNAMLLTHPVAGCIGLVRRGGRGDSDGRSSAGKSHIHGFLVHTVEADGTLVTVEGNFSHAVKWNRRRKPYNCDFVQIA